MKDSEEYEKFAFLFLAFVRRESCCSFLYLEVLHI
jgi:hypothetical protein